MNKDSKGSNALGIAFLYVFVSIFIILLATSYYRIDYIYWTYLFTAAILTITVAWIIWYAYLEGNIMLCILFWILGIIMLILTTYYILAYHNNNITVVIQPY